MKFNNSQSSSYPNVLIKLNSEKFPKWMLGIEPRTYWLVVRHADNQANGQSNENAKE